MTLRDHEASVAVFLALLLLISLSNLVGFRRLGRRGRRASPGDLPTVSILVPARNEERGVEACIRSLLAQDYPRFEVLVLDDGSTDRTAAILRDLSADARLRVLSGAPLPPGWLGKNWACHQLASAASGELLLFTDADTRHHSLAVRDAVAALDDERVDFLSVLPAQEMGTWGERLLVPLLPWSQQTFYPVVALRRAPLSALTTAIGQFMLFRRAAYEAIGGHARVRGSAVDDCDLVREVARGGLRWTLLDGTSRVTCRMYGSFREAVLGFSKNLFARFGYNLPVFAFVWSWLVWVTWQPPVLLVLRAVRPDLVSREVATYAAAATGISFLLWAIADLRFRVRLDHILAAPLTVLAAAAVAARSVVWHISRRGVWKGRPLYRAGD